MAEATPVPGFGTGIDGPPPVSRAAIEERLLARGGPGRTIPRLASGDAAELSFAQERMFLLERMLPGVTAYNVPRLFRVAGRIEPEAFQKALDVIVERHDVLRTTISLVDGTPTLAVQDGPGAELAVHDLRGQPDQEETAEALVAELAWQPFDLGRHMMMRAALVRVDDADIVLLVSHHLVSDHGSARILLAEIAEAYAAAVEGRTPSLPELSIQYADYAAWQRGRFTGRALETHIDYWCARLSGAPDRLDLPADRPRPPAKSYAGAERRFVVSAELAESLRALGRRQGVSFYTVLLSAFYVLLHRYSGAEDLVVGSPISGRHHEETQAPIGCFSNTLALRTVVEDEIGFLQLLERVRATTTEAFAHQEVPFERVVEALNPQRDPSHTPIFQVLFAHDVAPAALTLGEMTLEPLPLPSWPWSRFDLSLGTHESAGGWLNGIVEYSTDLFDAGTIDRMIGHFETLLGGIVEAPELPIGRLPLLTDPERRLLLEEWNRTERPVDQRCLNELVAAQAAATPERVAVEGSGQALTYGELDERANRLAHHLQKLNVGVGTLVGICLERVPELMVATLGVLKAGGAYVPLDPTYPAERQSFMLADAEALVLVTEESLVDGLPEHSARIVLLDADWDVIAREPGSAPAASLDRDALAYVIYTSGSTGKPKGVEIRHRSVVNLLGAMAEQPGLTSDDVVVNVTTAAFDLSVPDLYLPLVRGARLVVLPREITQDPGKLSAALEDAGATFVQATPTTWRLLVDAGWEGLPALKIVCGGEALSRSLANELVERGSSLWHMYGPTETTVWSSVLRLDRGHGSPPIGGPIANTRFYLVDRQLQPVPIGVSGELLIGGEGVARGYRNRSDLTAEKFIDDPFHQGDGGRLYRTGDHARFRSDGTLEFLGRLDHQVKLHGYRIELGEIEALLDRHPGVRESVAVVREDAFGEKLLAAYVVAEDGERPSHDDLRRHLGTSLPAYMMPTTIVVLDEFPVTANGKLDRAALPAPEVTRADIGGRYVAPRTPVEEVLTEIWAELLPVDRVGAEDDFFDLGGHSLLAVKMLSRLQDAFGIELFLTTVFERPTVESLAEAVTAVVFADALDDDVAALLVEAEAEGRE